MKSTYKNYLNIIPKSNGEHYSQTTIAMYSEEVNKICKKECQGNIKNFIKNIKKIVAMYDKGGIHESEGNYLNNTTINALKRFSEFLIFANNGGFNDYE